MSRNEDTAGQPLVLIADDDDVTRLITREALEQAGFAVMEASDGQAALQCHRHAAPDVILLDVEMPQLNGFEVCKKIRATETTRQTPICIMTGLADDESVDHAFKVGATDFICKPIAWPVLAHRLRYVLRASEALNEIRGLMLALPDVIFVLDENGCMHARPTCIEAGDHEGDEALKDASFEELFRQEDGDRIQECVKLALAGGQPQILEHYFARDSVHLETRFVARDRHSVLAIVRDVTERKKSESQIYDLAFYDRLTGLPNRQLFAQELVGIIQAARQQEKQFAVLFVDLDRFKRINDTLGHSMGDELLKAVARLLDGCIRSVDSLMRIGQDGHEDIRLARLGGDEFVIMLRDVGCEKVAASISSRLIATLSQPISCAGHQFVVTPSIGIAIYPQHGETQEELLMNADSAMYRAKAAGRNNFKFYSDSMKLRSLHRLDIENELRRAIQAQDFELYYQPKIDLSSWTIVGAEALLRWNHAERGWISPADFIPVAEETGLIVPLGAWVLQTACRQLGAWQASQLDQLGVSVNVSSEQMFSDDLIATVKGALADAGIGPQNLVLEITESLLMRDVESTIDTLIQMKEFGLGLSIDDFGTGYSSLAYLKRFPIDELKIDRSFVRDLHSDADDAAICAAILAMARRLDLRVVAEGVEIQEQLDFLRDQGCDQIQGYFFSRPVAASEFEALFLSHLGACERAAG